MVVAEDIEEAEEALVGEVAEVEGDEEVIVVVAVVDSVVEVVPVITAIKRAILQENVPKETDVTDKRTQGTITTKSTRFMNF